MVLFKRSAARNPRTNSRILAELAESNDAEIRKLVAGNRRAPGDVLEALARDPDASEEVLVAIARNPNADSATLGWLFDVGHSSGSLQMAIRGGLAANTSTPLQTRARLLECDDLRDIVLATGFVESDTARVELAKRTWDAGVLRLLARDPCDEVRRAVASSRRAAPEVLEALTQDAEPRVASVAMARRSTDRDWLGAMAETRDQLVLAAIVRNVGAPASVRSRAACALDLGTLDHEAVNDLAGSPATPADILELIAAIDDPEIRESLESNPTTPHLTLLSLVTESERHQAQRVDGGRSGRRGWLSAFGRIATDTSFSPEAFAALATADQAWVRQAVAKNPSTPTGLLLRLAADSDRDVRFQVAANESSPQAALERLSQDGEKPIVWQVARSPRVPGTILERIVEARGDQRHGRDSALDEMVKERWRQRDFPNFYAWDLGSQRNDRPILAVDILAAVAANLNCPPDVLQFLGDTPPDYLGPLPNAVRGTVAANPRTPPETLHEITTTLLETVGKPQTSTHVWGSQREACLWSIVGNPATSIATLRLLSDGRWIVLIRDPLDREKEEARRQSDLLSRLPARLRLEMSLRRWSSDASDRAVLPFAESEDTAPEILEILANDEAPSVRCAVAANPQTPTSAFHQLVRDPVVAVRQAAAGATHVDDPRRPSARLGTRFASGAFEVLAIDDAPEVRAALVANSDVFWRKLDDETLSRLLNDPEEVVRQAIVPSFLRLCDSSSWTPWVTTEALAFLTALDDPGVWGALAKSPQWHTNEEWVERICLVGDAGTLATLVRHLPPDSSALVRLASSTEPAVLAAYWERLTRVPESAYKELVRHRDAPPAAVETIVLRSTDIELLRAALRHPALSEDFRLALATKSDEKLLRALSELGSAQLSAAVASNELAPIDVLESLATLDDDAVRQALILNKSTPAHLLSRLVVK